MKKGTFSILSIGIWLICVLSLVGFHFYRKRGVRTPEFLIRGRSIINALDKEERANIARFDSSLIRLGDESIRLIGLGHESEEAILLKGNKIAAKKIEFRIGDKLQLEREFMINQALRTLNDAEKKCLQDRFATFIYRDGDYFLCYDTGKYQEYVLRYGTECKQCGEPAKQEPGQ